MAQLKQFKMQSATSEFNDGLRPDVERSLQTLVKTSPLIIFALSPEGIVKYADGAALKSLGIPANKAVGQSAFDLYKYAFWVHNAIRTVIREKRTVVASGKMSNGVIDFWYDARYVPVFDEKGALSEIVGYAIDMTAEKQAHDLAQQLAEEKIAAMTASMDGMVTIGAEGNIKYVNDSFVEIFGFKHHAELIGRNWRILFGGELFC
jgi:PAS domain S-box-containing protein